MQSILTWRPHRMDNLGLEYLRGRYKGGFVYDVGSELSHRDSFAARFSLEL